MMSESEPGSPPAFGAAARGAVEVAGFARHGFADQLSIDTPEQVALRFPVAGLGSRFVALLLDHLLQGAAVVVIVLLLVILGATLGSQARLQSLGSKWFLAAVTFAFFLLFWGYFTLFEAYWHGQTPGKRLMKLRVIKDSGRQITFFESLARNLLRVADFLPSLYFAGVIAMLTNQRNKRLGDLAAGTLVIHERSDEQSLLYTAAAGAPGSFSNGPFPADALARLSARDLIVIETFFARHLDLPLETRASMAARILAEMTGKMAVTAPEGNPERSLEAIGTSLRAGRRLFRS